MCKKENVFNSPDFEQPIVDFIEEYQRGKSGIYPHHVAMRVCARFGIKENEAIDYVLAHIKRVLAEVC